MALEWGTDAMKNSRARRLRHPAFMLALCLCSLATPVLARPELCEAAAAQAARESGVPVDVLQAIALTETGRNEGGRLRPWPWAANTEGRGHWFASREEVARYARETLARGQSSIDLGCFQINWRWHGENFAAPESLLDPLTAARYAAAYLSDLRVEFGSWEGAAGAYHSRTPHLAHRYRSRFRQMLARLAPSSRLALAAAQTPRPAHTSRPVQTSRPAQSVRPASQSRPYPLFSGVAQGASLVPATLPTAAPLF